jgi:hypothetical protein
MLAKLYSFSVSFHSAFQIGSTKVLGCEWTFPPELLIINKSTIWE